VAKLTLAYEAAAEQFLTAQLLDFAGHACGERLRSVVISDHFD
jgi:hypothetical protein